MKTKVLYCPLDNAPSVVDKVVVVTDNDMETTPLAARSKA